jgi:UDP-hydrolysing UDP-N-acetyl-D-glucosamine 2-epimerase
MRVLVYSGSRADYGGLESVVSALKARGVETDFDKSENFEPESVGSRTDMAVVLGDRFEVLRAVVELYIKKIPIAHLSGGDITQGSADDCMRHAITKLSHLHFVTNEESAKRVIQMGEEAWRVKTVGYPGVDALQTIDLEEAKKQAGIENFTDFVIVLWHPDTLTDDFQSRMESIILTQALNDLTQGILIIGPNSDAGNEFIRDQLKTWKELRVSESLRPTHYVEGLPRSVFLTLLANCKALIGNSSSGYYEAPSWGTPVVDIGDRQKGRVKSKNIINCRASYHEISKAINIALNQPKLEISNPYYTGNAAEKIAYEISRIKEPKKLLIKRFYDIKR